MGSFLNPIQFAKASNYGFDPIGAMVAMSPKGVQNWVGKETANDPVTNTWFAKDFTPEGVALARQYQAGRAYPNVSATGPYAGAQQTFALANQGYQPPGATPTQVGGGAIMPTGAAVASRNATGAAVASPNATGLTPQMRSSIWGNQQSQPSSGTALGSQW